MPSRHPAYPILIAALSLTLIDIAGAVKTDRVELGREGVYDGQVYVERDTSGTLLFRDTENTAPLSLTNLATGGVATHSALNGLNADDHPQYLNATRHEQTHNQTFNETLAIPPDANGNTSLGAHVIDSDIHLDRHANVEITGQWRFFGAPEFTTASIGGVALNLANPSPVTGDHLEYVGDNRAEWRAPDSSLAIDAENNQIVRANDSNGIQGSNWTIDDAGIMTGDTIRALSYEPTTTTASFLFRTRGPNQGYDWRNATSQTLMALDASGNMALSANLTVPGQVRATSLTLGSPLQSEILRIVEAANNGALIDVREAVTNGFNGSTDKVLAINDSNAYYITASGVFGGSTGQFVTLQGNYILGRYSNTDMQFRQGNASRLYRFQDQGNADVFVVDMEGGLYATSLTLTTAIALSGGAYSDGADWLTGSTRDTKTNIHTFEPEIAWERLDAMKPQNFHYKRRNPHFGKWLDTRDNVVESTQTLTLLNAPDTNTARASATAAGYRRDNRIRLEEPESQPRLGFIAEDLHAIDQRLAPNGCAVSAIAVAAHNTAALKEAKTRIERMQTQIDALREELVAIRLRFDTTNATHIEPEQLAKRRTIASP